MIARFQVLLPYYFFIPYNEPLEEINLEIDEYRVIIYSPMKANTDSSAYNVFSENTILNRPQDLSPEENPKPEQNIRVNGKEIIRANLIQIDLITNRDFNREKEIAADDPPVSIFFQILNSTIVKIRAYSRLFNVKPLEKDNCVWVIRDLSDDGKEMPVDDTKRRGRIHGVKSVQTARITANDWKSISFFPKDFVPQIWDTLFLDAQALLPNVNAAIVLTNAALESFMDFALNILAKESNLSEEMWNWLILRDNFLKQPSAKEKFNQVLKFLTGESLKTDEPELWKAYEELREVRNAIVHEGKAIIRKKTNKKKKIIETPVDATKAFELFVKAVEICHFVEKLLPLENQRLRTNEASEFQFTNLLPDEMRGSLSVKTEVRRIR